MDFNSLRAEIMVVTPAMARTWLSKRHPKQHERFSERVAHGYALQMSAGTWDRAHPQGITISSDGYLLDGQHRLEAVIIFNHPVEMLVVQGASKDSYKHIDAGFARSLAFRSNRPRDDMAIFTAVLGLAIHGSQKVRPTVEQIDACATFLHDSLVEFTSRTSKVRKVRLNPAFLRTAVILRMRDQPEHVEEIGNAYNAYMAGDFHAAPRSMSVLYRRMTEEYNPALNVFGLGWKAFDPKRFDHNMIKLSNVSDDIKNLQKTLLAPLVAAIKI